MNKQIEEFILWLYKTIKPDEMFYPDSTSESKDLETAHTKLQSLISDITTEAVNEVLAELLGEIDTMPHYIRSKFAEHVETTTADDAEMLLADEVKRIIKAQPLNKRSDV